MCCLDISDITIITFKDIDYLCIIHDISKSDAIHLSENYVLDDRGYLKMHSREINIKNRVYYFEYLRKSEK